MHFVFTYLEAAITRRPEGTWWEGLLELEKISIILEEDA